MENIPTPGSGVISEESGSTGPRLGAAIDRFEAIALWLIRCYRWQKLVLVVGSIVVVTLLDLCPTFEAVNLRSLYVIPVALACWTLRPVHAATVTVGIVGVLFVKAELSYGNPEFLSLIASATARTLAYATVAAFVLSFRRLYDRTFAAARHDQMTGVLNKTTFEQEAANILSGGWGARSTILIAALDLDGFKQLNDAHGHAAGDAVLKGFSLNLTREIRRSDRIGRVGGDEFGLILQVGSAKEGKHLARDLHARVSNALAAMGQPITFSMGAVIVPPEVPRAFDPMMDEADQLLYTAKRHGKNTVVVGIAGATGNGVGRLTGAAAVQMVAGATAAA